MILPGRHDTRTFIVFLRDSGNCIPKVRSKPIKSSFGRPSLA